MHSFIFFQHAAYLAEEQGLSVTDAVLNALSKAGFDNLTAPKVLIQSSNSSVLQKFKEKNNYELVYKIDEKIRSIDEPTLKDIKSFADSVVINKASVFPDNSLFLTGSTDVVKKLQSYKLPVYVETFSNEFVSQAWDFFSDATVEVNSYVTGANVDGVITDFPATAARYKSKYIVLYLLSFTLVASLNDAIYSTLAYILVMQLFSGSWVLKLLWLISIPSFLNYPAGQNSGKKKIRLSNLFYTNINRFSQL